MCAAYSGRPGLGGLAIVVNNAGILHDRMLFNMSDEDWDAVIAVHVRGHFLVTRNAARLLAPKAKQAKEADGSVYGRIINTSSEAGLVGPAPSALRNRPSRVQPPWSSSSMRSPTKTENQFPTPRY